MPVQKGALPKVNCSTTADFIPRMTKFQRGIVHVNSCLILGFHDSNSTCTSPGVLVLAHKELPGVTGNSKQCSIQVWLSQVTY